MNVTPPYEFQQYHVREERLPSIKRMFDTIDQQSRSAAGGSAKKAFFVSQQPLSPPDLLHDLEEDDENSLRTLSSSSSPEQQNLFPINNHESISSSTSGSESAVNVKPTIILPSPHTMMNNNRRKLVPPRRSPSITAGGDVYPISTYDRSVVFQLNAHSHCTSLSSFNNLDDALSSNQSSICVNHHCGPCDFQRTSSASTKVICGQSLLSVLREKVAHARTLNQLGVSTLRRSIQHPRTASIIEIPRSHHHQSAEQQQQQQDDEDDESASMDGDTSNTQSRQRPSIENESYPQAPQQKRQQQDHIDQEQYQIKRTKKTSAKLTTQHHRHQSSSGRPSRVKGPCQACHEESDGCMRKAFNWPFPASQVFNDKGRPFVYLCNKCGLRYNKSGGAVCRSCRWVICKEEKRKALQHIDAMRRKRPNGHVDFDEDIENFVCSPKYWTCGQAWKVGWVLSQVDDGDDDDVSSPDYSFH